MTESRRFLPPALVPLAFVASLALLAPPARAQYGEPARGLGFRGWGPRAGVTANPDQFHFGAQLDLGAIARRVRFVPDVEFGFGDHLKVTAFNVDLFYRFTPEWEAWAPYAGLGPAFLIVDAETDFGQGGTNTDVGLNLVLGIERGFSRRNLFSEIKVGIADAPDFKISAGLTFLSERSGSPF